MSDRQWMIVRWLVTGFLVGLCFTIAKYNARPHRGMTPERVKFFAPREGRFDRIHKWKEQERKRLEDGR